MTHSTETRPAPELLAPAGDWESLRAAVANGADAVYFGLPLFNARHRAHNFTLEELPTVMAYLHDRNVRGFITLNTLIFPDELPDVADYLAAIAAAGVDAVIVQDLGLVTLIRATAPSLAIHGSTQMTLTEPRGIDFVASLGVERVVLARELSLDEIRKVTAGTNVPVEVFVHGALCVAYSGQCLTSEALGGRSANRGQCAQACRLPYEMIVDGTQRDLGDRAYLLSPQDLAAYEQVGELTKAGVISFKIEGRLKGGPYVAATTQTYRAAIDEAVKGGQFALDAVGQRELAQVFSRGLTPGFLNGNDHQKLVQGRFPKSRGICIGSVRSVSRRGVHVSLTDRDFSVIRAGDGVVFDLGTPAEKEPGGRVWTARPVGDDVVELTFAAEAIDCSQVPIGCRVWKTDDPVLRKRLEQSYAHDRPARRRPLNVKVRGRAGEALTVTANGISVTWPGPLELARKHALDEAAIREQWNRLTDTPYELAEVTLDLPDPVMVPRSVMNDLRRQALVLLAEKQVTVDTIVDRDALMRLRERSAAEAATIVEHASRVLESTSTRDACSTIKPADSNVPTLNVLVRTIEQLDAVLTLPAIGMVYCDFEDTRRYREAVSRAREANKPIGLATLRVLKPGEEGFLRPILTAAPDAVLVRNLAGISYFQEHLPGATLIGDFSLNVANDLTARLLIDSGLARLVPSFDLNWEQFTDLMRHAPPAWFETVIHQHMPMFHMEHCVFAAFLSKGKDFRDCGRPCDSHKVELRDRVGAEFPVVPDTGCRNTVFNSVAQSAAEYIGRMRALGLTQFRVDLLRETGEEAAQLLGEYSRALSGEDVGRQTWKRLQVINQLGVTRGTLQ